MTIVIYGETFYVGATWYDSATSSTGSGSILFGVPGGPIYMSGVLTVSNTTVQSGGRLVISAGGTASNTNVNGAETVLNGAPRSERSSTRGDPPQLKRGGGTSVDTTVGSNALLSLLGGAKLGGTTTINSGGALAIEDGYTENGFVASNGIILAIGAGGLAVDTVVDNGGREEVFIGGRAEATTAVAGCCKYLFFRVRF